MAESQSNSSSSFGRAFLPGVVVGLIIGLAIGAFVPPWLERSPTTGGPASGGSGGPVVRDERSESPGSPSTPGEVPGNTEAPTPAPVEPAPSSTPSGPQTTPPGPR